jgi:pimeloyl-ACP methyl ester carboxylesterase
MAAAALLPLALTGLACTAGPPGRAADMADTRPAAVGWARLADQVPTPDLRWTTCRKTDQCATARLPLNYHQPRGATIKIALLRVRAAGPRRRLGTIFVNPGGPGGSARDLAAQARLFLPASILDRFDIVGVDPRGVGGSTPLQCFSTRAAEHRTLAPFVAAQFPDTAARQRTWIAAARMLGRACSTTGRRIAAHMSTTDDALDMDVLRRAVGDRALTFVGESYGTYLGEVYANMFPGRVRAIVLDGVVSPRAWAGTPATARVPLWHRLGADAASDRVLRELLSVCRQAGHARCSFASPDTAARFARLAARLRSRPLRLTVPGRAPTTFGYATLIDDTGQWLRQPAGYRGLFAELTDLARLTAPGGAGSGRPAVVAGLLRLHRELLPPAGYDTIFQASAGVLCTDGPSAARAASWPAAAAAANRQDPYFGGAGAWVTVPCARDTWTARDPDVYRGPFDHRTASPLLVIGATWDPVTSYASAVQVARQMPGSRLVASDSWGHTALLTSPCVDNTTWAYLLHPRARAPRVTRCRGTVQPFPAPSAR